MNPFYEDTANRLVQRIIDTVPKEKLLTIDDPWELFKVDGFHCEDIAPSLFQAGWALATARKRLQEL